MALFNDIEIEVREMRSSVSAIHRHHYFELLYILEGSGIHTINNNNHIFKKGNLYLLTPEDTHTFKIDDFTTCCIIDFTKGLFAKRHRKEADRADMTEFFVSMEYIFLNHQQLKGHIEMNPDECQLTDKLIKQLVSEREKPRIYGNIIIQNIVFLLLNMIARLIQENRAGELKSSGNKNIVYEITAYVQQNIYKKDLLKISNLARNFHKTPDHLNRYFKMQTGHTLKSYINRYKLNLVEARLQYSDLTISEIAEEMGFTDESHLNKFIKLFVGKTAKAYRASSVSL